MSHYRILTLNIHKGFSMSNRQFTLELIRENLRESEANVVFLQEVVGENLPHREKISGWPDGNQMEYLADSVWDHFAYGKNAIYQHGHHGNAILSEIPFKAFRNINISCLSFSRRGILHGLTQEGVNLLCVHLGLFERERSQQVDRLIEYAQEHIADDAPLIVAGDFNDWRLKCHRRLQEELGLQESHQSVQGNLAKTYPANFPLLAMDRIYQRGFEVLESRILDSKAWRRMSDHRGLMTELALKA
jgi:endonuclease/exonuclease/phosphatase family metal-dependent hydrolase